MRLMLSLCSLLLLAGCATTSPEVLTETRTVTHEVKVPVPVACIDPADMPALPARTPIDLANATVDQKAAALAADAEQFERYARAVEVLLAQCAKGGSR